MAISDLKSDAMLLTRYYTVNVLISTFYIYVKNPPTDEGYFNRFLFVVKRTFLTQYL